MDKTLQIQTQIRHNAEEISTALSEMGKWEKQMKNRDGNIKAAHMKAARVPRAPIRSGVGTVPVQDKVEIKTTEPRKSAPTQPASSLWQTPSSIVANATPLRSSAAAENVAVPSARGTYEAKDVEESERERGNAEFKGGNFTAAVKCYTKCLGLKGRNYVAFSNRAMAYLKLKEYARAVSDCSCALLIEPSHVKSLLRRSTAYNAVGKHRAALRDLMTAAAIEPANKQVRQDMLTTKELLRNAVSRAPLVNLHLLHANHHGTQNATDESSGVICGVEVGVQGPDVRPPNFTTVEIVEEEEGEGEREVEEVEKVMVAPASATVVHAEATPSESPVHPEAEYPAATSTTRVAISIEDDSDTEDSPTTTITTPNAAAANTDGATTPTKTVSTATTATSSSKKPKKVTPVSPTAASTASITSCYELERELEIASKDPVLIARVFERIKRTEIKAILSKLLEPTVLYRLLNAAYLHFGTHKASICVKWYATVAGTKKFGIQYGLLDEMYKVTLRNNLQTIWEYVSGNEVEGLSVDRIAEVQALY